ncbi:MAG TPA: hypothetical protein VNK46_14245 [Nitrospiraceae bacterium]|jgi:hypothetical protein|nr:hypothetical protein [Nitrospiraceae bacterium]
MVRKNTKNREKQVGTLEIVCAVIAVAAVAASATWGLQLNLLIALVMLVAAYAVLRDVRLLWRLKQQNGESDVAANRLRAVENPARVQFLRGGRDRAASSERSAPPVSSNPR